MCKIVKEICLDEGLAFIHAITPNGGAGKSIYNNEKIDIYDRFNFNIRERKGIAASVIKNNMQPSKTFGTQGLIIFDGKVNNVNRSDAGSQFNDSNGLWETPDGIQFPSAIEVRNEIKMAANTYVEINIFNYSICGFFMILSDPFLKSNIRSLNEFFSKTNKYKLPYYGIDNGIIIRIKEKNLMTEDWKRIGEGNIVNIDEIYNGQFVI